MIKMYEVTPDKRSYPIETFEWGEGYWLENVTVTGNKDYYSHKSKLFEQAEMLFDFIMNYDFDPCDVKEAFNIVDYESLVKANSENNTEEIYCLLMTALSGEKYDVKMLTGLVQGEWNWMFYRKNEWTEKQIEDFEILYFNNGSEWKVCNEDEEFYLYSCEWDDDKIKEDLASECGYNVEEVEFYRFDGYSMQPKYKEI